MNNRINMMRESREIPQTILHRYNQLRSQHNHEVIYAFESTDDFIFYKTMISRVKNRIKITPLICKKKDTILALRTSLSRNISATASLIRYFVDHDFDGLKGHPPGNDIYCTPCYSFENLIVNEQVLENLLHGEFKCSDSDAETDLKNIKKIYQERWIEFLNEIRDANKIIFHAHHSGFYLKGIDDNLKKYVKITLKKVTKIANTEEICKIIGFIPAPTEADISTSEHAFKLLDPERDWRGKFSFYFFKKILTDLKEDRGRKTPSFFSKRASISFSPNGDINRALASITPIPNCLKKFISNLPNQGITQNSSSN